MKYKVGDRVRVKDDLIIGKLYGSYCFIHDMVKYKNREFTIDFVHYDCYELTNISYCWTNSMLEPATTINIKPQELFALLEE